MNMRTRLLFQTAAVLAAAIFSASCNSQGGGNARTGGPSEPARQESPSPQPASPADGVRRVTIQELRDALERGEAVAVDVRGGVDYKLGHIRGALSLPLGLISQRARSIPRDKLVVTYCA